MQRLDRTTFESSRAGKGSDPRFLVGGGHSEAIARDKSKAASGPDSSVLLQWLRRKSAGDEEEHDVYVTIRRYQANPDSVEEVTRRVEEGFAPIVSGTRGFVAYYLLDAGDGVLASVSVFEDREGAEESNKRAAEWAEKDLASLLPDPPEVTAGEVGVYEEGEGMGASGHASIRRYQINQGAVREALRQFSEGIVPTLRDQPGFVEYYGLEAENEIVAINLFEGPSEAQESNKVAAGYVEQNLSSLLPLSPMITVGELVVRRTG